MTKIREMIEQQKAQLAELAPDREWIEPEVQELIFNLVHCLNGKEGPDAYFAGAIEPLLPLFSRHDLWLLIGGLAAGFFPDFPGGHRTKELVGKVLDHYRQRGDEPIATARHP